MCIYGVTQVGAGSVGPSRFLPGLLTALQVLKPALVFLTGAWFVLYWVNRRTATGPLMPRVLLATLLLGLVAAGDSAAEEAYLIIPKKEEFLAAGCCTGKFEATPSLTGRVTGALTGEGSRPWLTGTYIGVNLGMALALAAYLRRPDWRQRGLGLVPLGLGALVSWPVNLLFLIGVAAPTLLRLAHHHCPYDLIPAVPESLVALGLFVLGSFAVGWACVAGWLGGCRETRPFLGNEVGQLLRLALWGYVASVAMLSFEMALA